MAWNAYFEKVAYVADNLSGNEVVKIMDIIEQAIREDRQIFIIGNGGSAATASHVATDLRKLGRFCRAQSLTDNVPMITMIGNDFAFKDIFKTQLLDLAIAGDVLLSISASGNSENIIEAVRWMNSIKGRTLAWTGFDGGDVAKFSEVAVIVPRAEYGPVEDVHAMLNHMLFEHLRDKFH